MKEEGEDCDCGANCNTSACCTNDCKFKNGAVCDDKASVCCSGCQLKPKGQVCRASIGSCDFTEYCDGEHDTCPKDVQRENGEACIAKDGMTSAYCANGTCTNRDLQCIARTNSNFQPVGACADFVDSCNMVCVDSLSTCARYTGNFTGNFFYSFDG